MERLVDAAAHEMGIDPIELRRRNHIRPESFPYVAPNEMTYDCGDFGAVLDKAVAALRGSSMKDLIINAVEREVSRPAPAKAKRIQLPIIRSWKGPKLDLTGFDFDDLLG